MLIKLGYNFKIVPSNSIIMQKDRESTYYLLCFSIVFIITGMLCIYSLTALSVQRCMLLRYPTSNLQNTYSCTKVAIGIIWLMASIIAIPPLLGWSEYVPEESGLRYVTRYTDNLCLLYVFVEIS